MDIEPFNEFWLNCELNDMLSILCSSNPSFAKSAYMNAYTYYKYEPKELCNGIDVCRKDLYQFLEEYIEIIPYNFKDGKLFLEEIIEKIALGIPLGLAVDLYDWLPNTIVYRKKHWYHYSLIIGYIDRKSEFVVLDEDNLGYRKHFIPKQKLMKAFLPDTMESQAILYRIKKGKFDDYAIDVNKMRSYANKIIQSIDTLPDHIWDNELGREREQAVKMMIASTSRIYNCQRSNKCLLDELTSVEKCDYGDLYVSLESNEKNWKMIHNYLLKADMKNKEVDYGRINNLSENVYIEKNVLGENVENEVIKFENK